RSCRNVKCFRVSSKGGWLHCFDAQASTYINEWGNNGGDKITEPVPQPCQNIVYEQCYAENPMWDDAFTCHSSNNFTYIDCHASFTKDYTSFPPPTATGKVSPNGFEIDEGMSGVTLRGCTADGFVTSFQV